MSSVLCGNLIVPLPLSSTARARPPAAVHEEQQTTEMAAQSVYEYEVRQIRAEMLLTDLKSYHTQERIKQHENLLALPEPQGGVLIPLSASSLSSPLISTQRRFVVC